MNLFIVWKMVSNFAMYLSEPYRNVANTFYNTVDRKYSHKDHTMIYHGKLDLKIIVHLTL